VACAEGEDEYAVGRCRLTCRYRTRPGDFVSRNVLGCYNALTTGRIGCRGREAALRPIANTRTVIGLTGPDSEVAAIAAALARRLGGMLVFESGAEVAAEPEAVAERLGA
jgi:hypothetical protein